MKVTRLLSLLLFASVITSAKPINPGIQEFQDTVIQEILSIPVSEITREATLISSRLLDKEGSLLLADEKRAISSSTDTLTFRLNMLREDPRIQRISTLNFRNLTQLESDWLLLNSRLINEQTTLTRMVQAMVAENAELDGMNMKWFSTLNSASEQEAPEMIIQQVNSILENIKMLQDSIRVDSDFLQERLVLISRNIIFSNEVMADIRSSQTEAAKLLFSLNQPPIWKEFEAKGDTLLITGRRSIINDTRSSIGYFVTNSSFKILLHILFSIIILIFINVLFRNLRNYIHNEELPQVNAIKEIIKRPFSSALLLSMLLVYIMFEAIPGAIQLITMLLLFIPVLIILSQIISIKNKQIIYLPVVAAVFVQIHGLGHTETVLSRFALLFIILFALFFIVLAIRTYTMPENAGSHKRRRLINGVALIYLVLLGISLLSVIAGAVMLAEFITYSIIRSTALILIVYALSLTINSVLFTVMYSKGMVRLNLIRQYQEEIYRKLAMFVRFLAWVFWLILTFRIFTVWDELYSFLKNFFTKSATVGTVDISLGNIILFVFLIWFTIWLSRMVKIVIEGEIAPRVTMKRGVPGALSLILRIIIISIGFLFAIAVAGIGMDKLAILLGALGVGIGFGLQNIFNNLVSGIILAFERPIQEGDIIEVGDLWGTVKEIGLRSSTVFTFYGAEVIVPNGNLISKELINWTLTDQQRRVEVDVGVKYGTDPEKVLEILRKISSEHKGIIDEPAPLALFSGFGESSLDFRLLFWIPRGRDRFILQSEINVLINKALKDSGIEIPFPQRDLHVRSVDPTVLQKGQGERRTIEGLKGKGPKKRG